MSPNSSSSSDSFNDSFEQIYKSSKKTTNSNPTSTKPVEDSTSQPLTSDSKSEKNKIGEEECDELDQLFKNIDLKDTSDRIPLDWLEQNEPPLQNTMPLSIVYEDNESKYQSSKSINSSKISKNSCNSDLSQDSLTKSFKATETSKDSLDMFSVSSNVDVPIELNDTLEDVEYVYDEKNRYLLQPVSRGCKEPGISTSVACSSGNSSVIIVDSSPETSFATAQNDLKIIDVKYIKSEISSDNSSLSYNTLTTLDSKKDDSAAATVSSTNISYTTARNELKCIDTDDVKSEISCDKSTISAAKTNGNNSWTTLDSSDDTSTAPMATKINDSLSMASYGLKRLESEDSKSENSSEAPLFSCISYPKTTSFFEIDRDKSGASEIGKSSEYYTAASANQSSSTKSSLNSQPSVSAARFVKTFFYSSLLRMYSHRCSFIQIHFLMSSRYNTLDDISSLMTDNSTVSSINHSNIPQTNSTDTSRNFNDSLERIEYMMKKGRELQEKTNPNLLTSGSSSAVRGIGSPVSHYKTPSQKRTLATTGLKGVTPGAKAKLFSNSAKKTVNPSPVSAITPATRILKPFNRVPSSTKIQSTERKFTSPNISPGFKKPNFLTPSVKRDGQSRIPTSKNKHFEHIVSPIGAYIKNIAAPPLLANVKPTSDFFDSSYCNKIPKELDYSVMSDTRASIIPVPSLPVKFFSSSDQQRVGVLST